MGWVHIMDSAEDAEWHSRNFNRAPQGRGLGPGKQWPRINWTIAASCCSSTVNLLLSQHGPPPRLTSEQLLEEVSFLPDFWWEELMSFSTLTLGKEENVFSRAVTIINRPDRPLNMAVLVGMFSWIEFHVSRSVKWFCVCVACHIMISLIHLS